MIRGVKCVLPPLATKHPGYFRVALALIVLHLGLGIDFLLPGRHGIPIFAALGSILPIPLIAVVHLGTAAMIIYGLYRNFPVARWGFRISVTTFWAMTAACGWAALVNPAVSFAAFCNYAFVSVCSAAAAAEPEAGPQQHDHDCEQVQVAAEEVCLLLDEIIGVRDAH